MYTFRMNTESNRSYETETCHPNSCYVFGDTAGIYVTPPTLCQESYFQTF